MTEKRYSDGTLAKWYYSRNNVISDGNNEYYLRNKESTKDWNYNELLGTNDLLDELNRLTDENEQLKETLGFLKNDNVNAIVDPTTFVLNLQQSTIRELTNENEQLKEQLKLNCPNIVWRDLE